MVMVPHLLIPLIARHINNKTTHMHVFRLWFSLVMQQWFQIVDVKATEDLTESDCETSDFEAGICTYYESLTCSFQYTDKILDGGVTIANSIIQGYKGVYEMKDAIGAFSDIVILNKTSTYPWFIDYERSDVQLSSRAPDRDNVLP